MFLPDWNTRREGQDSPVRTRLQNLREKYIESMPKERKGCIYNEDMVITEEWESMKSMKANCIGVQSAFVRDILATLAKT